MQPSRSRVGEPARDRHRVVAVDGLPREVALAQADHPAVTKVDRGRISKGVARAWHHATVLAR